MQFVTAAPALSAADHTRIADISAGWAAVMAEAAPVGLADKTAGIPSVRQTLQPFFDLSGEGRALFARTLALVADSLQQDGPLPFSQGATYLGFRKNVVRGSGQPEYRPDLVMPGELPDKLQSATWRSLCKLVEAWDSLTTSTRARVAALLNKLSLYEATLRLLPSPAETGDLCDEATASAEIRRIVAESKVRGATVDTAGALARVAAHGPRAAVLACAILLVVYYGRFTRDAGQLERWAVLTRSLTDGYESGTPRERLMRSVVLRGASFVPMAARDAAAVWRMLDEALTLAEGLRTESSLPAALALENLYTITETRSNVACLFGDRPLAREIAEGLFAIDPFDQRPCVKMGDLWFEDGEFEEASRHYLAAAAAGPPLAATGCYGVAQCQERLGDRQAALAFYARSVDADPGAVSALIGIRRLTREPVGVSPPVANQVDGHLAYLRERVGTTANVTKEQQ